MIKNYEFLKVKENLFRIKALNDIKIESPTANMIIKKGMLGGYIESEMNLPQDSNSWIFEDGVVRGNATIRDTVLISGEIKGNAIVIGSYLDGKDISIYDNAIVEKSTIYGNVAIYQYSVVRYCNLGTKANNNILEIRGNTTMVHTTVSSNVSIYGGNINISNSRIVDGSSNVSIYGGIVNINNSRIVEGSIHGDVNIKDCILNCAYVYDSAIVSNSTISNSKVYDNAKVLNCKINENSEIRGNTVVEYSDVFNSNISGDSRVYESKVNNKSKIYCNPLICDSIVCNSSIGGHVIIRNSDIVDFAKLEGKSILDDIHIDSDGIS